MNVKEFYEAVDGDYEEMKRKFLSDARIRRFALMFLRDGSMEDLRAGMRDGDYEKAFLAAHTLKGVCLNLGFSGLLAPVSEITELLRSVANAEAAGLMPVAEQVYAATVEGLRELERSEAIPR